MLLIDADPERRQALAVLLNGYCRCQAVADIAQLPQAGASAAILVASTDEQRTSHDFETLLKVWPTERLAILSARSLDPQLDQLFSVGARQFLSGAATRLDRELGWQIRALLTTTPGVSLEQLFGPMSEARVVLVRDRWERQDAVEQAVAFFADAQFPDAVVDIRLALDEMLNNALYHSFRDDEGHEKYTAETFDTLEGDDVVSLQIARNPDYNLVSVSDTSGSLRAETVTQNLARHLTMKGLLDEHGRGFFLMRSISDGMLVRIQPGIRTEVTLVFGRHSNAMAKSLLVKYLE